MCKIHRIHYSINTQKNSVNKITECIVIFKKIGKCNCMRFFFVGYINTLKQELNSTKAYKEASTDEKTVVTSHSNDLPYKFAVNVKEHQDILPTIYWLLQKRPYIKARFIANSSSCTTAELYKLLTSCFTAVKSRVIRYYETVYERSRKNMFGL